MDAYTTQEVRENEYVECPTRGTVGMESPTRRTIGMGSQTRGAFGMESPARGAFGMESPARTVSVEELLAEVDELKRTNAALLESNRVLIAQNKDSRRLKAELDETKEHLHKVKKQVRSMGKKSNGDIVSGVQRLSRQISNKELLEMDPSELEDVLTPCTCGTVDKLNEVMKINQLWQQDYDSITQKLANTTNLVVAYKDKCTILQTECGKLKSKLSRSSSPLESDETEALKQQMILYKEDYQEMSELNRRNSNELSELRIKLNKSAELITKLERQYGIAERNCKLARMEKENILLQLRKLTSETPTLNLEPLPENMHHPMTYRSHSERRQIPSQQQPRSYHNTQRSVSEGGIFEGEALVVDLRRRSSGEASKSR